MHVWTQSTKVVLTLSQAIQLSNYWQNTDCLLFKSHKLEVDLTKHACYVLFYQWAAPRLCRFHTEVVSSALPSDQWIRWCPGPKTEAALPAPPAHLSAGPPAARTHMHKINQSAFSMRGKKEEKKKLPHSSCSEPIQEKFYLDFILAFLLLRQLVCEGVAPRLQLPDIVLAVSHLLRLHLFLWRRERRLCLDDDIVTLPENTHAQMRCYHRYLCFTAFACLFTSGIYIIYGKENSRISSKNILEC